MLNRPVLPDANPDTPSATARPCADRHADRDTLERLRAQVVSEATAGRLAEAFRLLGDPTRVRLLDALAHGEQCVCDLAAIVGISESAVSHQLRLLRGARLARARRHGRMVFYALDDRHILTLLQQGLSHVRERSGD